MECDIHTVLVDEIEFGAVADQQRHHLRVASFASDEDRRSSRCLTSNVSVGAGLEQ